MLEELKQHEADASELENQMKSPLPCRCSDDKRSKPTRLHNHGPAGASPPRGFRTNAFGRLAPNDVEASSRNRGSRTGLGAVVGLWVVTRSGREVDRRDPVMRANLAAAYGRAGGDDRHAP